MTAQHDERRQGQDRRRAPRGGRRPGDRDGYTPLVLVVDDDDDSNTRCEAILAKLRFAVAPAHSADEAVRVMRVLRPSLVVAHLKDETVLRRQMSTEPAIASVPILSLTGESAEPAALVEEVRRALRAVTSSH